MNKRLLIILALTTFICNFARAAKVWDIGGPIAGGSISSPVDNGMYICGAGVDFTCSRGTDPDHWCDASVPSEGTSNDAMATNYPQWTASAGSWKDGDYIGTSVEWIAPNSELTDITVSVYENDLPYSIPPGDSGTRDDSVTLQDTVTGILVFIPFLYEVDYEGGNHAIYDVTTPEYSYATRNEPASWSFEADAEAKARFYRPGATLSQNEGGIKVRAETSGDGFNIGDWGDSTTATWTLPSPWMTCVSEMTIDDSVQYQDYSAQWKYKCTDGSNDWISTTNQSGCRLYVVYGSNLDDADNYIKDNLEWACSNAQGQDTIIGIADAIHSALNANPPIDGGGSTQSDDWELLDGAPYKADCDNQARFMNRVLKLLGLNVGSPDLVYASSNSGTGNCLDLESKTESGIKKWLIMDFDSGTGYNWNAYEGVLVVTDEASEDYYYAVWPSKKADDDYDMLKNKLGPQQYWVKTYNDVQPGSSSWSVETVYDEESLP
jgi:hypothetical protein